MRSPTASCALRWSRAFFLLQTNFQYPQTVPARPSTVAARPRESFRSAICGGMIFAPPGKRKSQMKFALGQSIPRLEDDNLLRGAGGYRVDFMLARAAHVVFVRSPHAHSKIKGVDASAAARMPGVIAVLT